MTEAEQFERIVADWRNYKAGWFNGALMGFVFGCAVVIALFVFGRAA